MSTVTVEAAPTPTTPEGWARHWQVEIDAAKQRVEKYLETARRVDRRFRDERDDKEAKQTRWNLFTTNVQTQQALLYGQSPKVSVSRRFGDADDDVGRVAGVIMDRLLNSDIERDEDPYRLAIGYALQDRLIPGFGNVRVRYTAKFEKVPEQPAQLRPDGTELAPAVMEHEKKVYEDCETDYVHWEDQLWSSARVWPEVRWWDFQNWMTRDALVERFGEEIGRAVPLQSSEKTKEGEEKKQDPLARAKVHEIWSKEHRKVFWFVEGYGRILDEKDDPLGLDGFWPMPRPMMANLTTSKLLPRPDFVIAEDLYNDIDKVSTRITLLEEAIRVAGVYPKDAGELKRLIDGSQANILIPIENFAMFAEKGGIRGQMDFLPLDQIVGALTALRDYRRELQDALYQITGMSDILRGQASTPDVTAAEQTLKAKFGSVRMQALQDEFARFATDVCKLRAEVIAKRFDPETIMARCNCANTPDAQYAQQAIELIKSGQANNRIEVKPESVSLTDFAQMKAERMEVIAGISTFLTAAAPLAQQMPAAGPALLKVLQWSLAALRGASEIESVLDEAIHAAEQAQQQAAANPQAAPPDPKVVAQQLKGQQDLAKVQAELQADLTRTQAEVQADAQREQTQAIWNSREAAMKQQISTAAKAAMPQQPNLNPRKVT